MLRVALVFKMLISLILITTCVVNAKSFNVNECACVCSSIEKVQDENHMIHYQDMVQLVQCACTGVIVLHKFNDSMPELCKPCNCKQELGNTSTIMEPDSICCPKPKVVIPNNFISNKVPKMRPNFRKLVDKMSTSHVIIVCAVLTCVLFTLIYIALYMDVIVFCGTYKVEAMDVNSSERGFPAENRCWNADTSDDEQSV